MFVVLLAHLANLDRGEELNECVSEEIVVDLIAEFQGNTQEVWR